MIIKVVHTNHVLVFIVLILNHSISVFEQCRMAGNIHIGHLPDFSLNTIFIIYPSKSGRNLCRQAPLIQIGLADLSILSIISVDNR